MRYACRALLKTPGFTLAVVTTLAIGIGASTAIFSVAYGVALRALPYPQPDRLVRIYEANPSSGDTKHDASLGAFRRWRDASSSIEAAAAFSKPDTRYLAHGGSPVTFMSVSAAFFDVLGVRPLVGAGFKPEREYTHVTADKEAIISYAAWQRLLGGRSDVIGQTLEFNGVGDNDVYRVIGVMPADFRFDQRIDVWRPTLIAEPPITRALGWRYYGVVARVREGATIERARAEVQAASAQLAQDAPATSRGWTAAIEPLHDAVVGAFARATRLMLAAVAVVLLVACLNLGGLVLSRAIARERETAVRVSLGAGSWRIARLWLAEGTLLAALGTALGLALAWTGISALKTAAPPGIPRLDTLAIDAPVLAVALACALVALFTATLAPLALTRARDFPARLRSGSAGTGVRPAAHALRSILTLVQCAGATVLLILASMLTRSLLNLLSSDPGWDATGVLSLKVSPPMPRDVRRPWALYVDWSDRLVGRLDHTPGIRSAAITTQIPLAPGAYQSAVARGRGKDPSDNERWPAVTHNVSDGFFDTMGIDLRAGRMFDARDRFTAAALVGDAARPQGTAIVSESTARALWPGRSAIGQTLWLPDIDVVAWREVVGVVEDIQFYAVGERPALHVFVPWTQFPSGNPRLVVRGVGDSAAIAALVKDVVQSVQPGTHIDQVVGLDTLVAQATAQPRFTSEIVELFGVLALALAAVGIYGTLAYIVRARTREIGVRLALGASRRDILTRTLRYGVRPALAGAVLGMGGAAAIAVSFRALLFGIAPLDLRSSTVALALLLASSVAAALGPAVRAARVDPVVALRTE